MLAAEAHLLDGSLLATAQGLADLRAHALRDFPREAVGYLTPDGGYQPLANVSPEPEGSALVPTATLSKLMRTGQLRAFCHSHPNGPDCPSEQDMALQQELEVPFVLVSTNGQACTEPFAWGDELIDERDLLARPFRHGVDDCYALIRAWWLKERGVRLPDYPRNWEWWRDEAAGEKDLYRTYFADAGFRVIPSSQVREGDVWLAAIRSSVPNHAGVVLAGAGLTLHHPSGGLAHDPMRLSKRDVLARWVPYITHWLRRDEC